MTSRLLKKLLQKCQIKTYRILQIMLNYIIVTHKRTVAALRRSFFGYT